MDAQFKSIADKQLALAKQFSLKPARVERLKENFDRQVNILVGHKLSVTKHTTYDSVFYIAYTPNKGYRAVKFYHNFSDYRIGTYCESAAEAYTDALCYM